MSEGQADVAALLKLIPILNDKWGVKWWPQFGVENASVIRVRYGAKVLTRSRQKDDFEDASVSPRVQSTCEKMTAATRTIPATARSGIS